MFIPKIEFLETFYKHTKDLLVTNTAQSLFFFRPFFHSDSIIDCVNAEEMNAFYTILLNNLKLSELDLTEPAHV